MADMIDYEKLLKMWREEKKKRQEVEGELSIIKATTVDNSPEMRDAKKEIDRLTEQVNNFEIISKSHKELNGQLRKELDEKNKDFNALQKKLDDLKKSVEGRLEELRNKGLV